MSYHVDSLTEGNFIVDDYEKSFTTDQYYDEALKDVDDSSATTQYREDLNAQLSKAFLFLTQLISEEQFNTIVSFIEELHKIQDKCQCKLLKNISVYPSEENELIFYRKEEKGVSFLSIDTDGDVLFNYTGYKNGSQTYRYKFGNIDIELVAYNFLSNY